MHQFEIFWLISLKAAKYWCIYFIYYIFLCSILYFQIKVTTCGGVKLELISTWKDDKVWEYKSTNSADPPQVWELSEEPGLVSTSSVVTPSPKK